MITRWRRHLGCAPADRIAADRAVMTSLPPVAPATGWRRAGRLPRDHYVRLDGNDYSRQDPLIAVRIAFHRGPGPGPGLVRRAAGR